MSDAETTLYLNGAYVSEGEASVSVFDRCFLYGDGIFEGIAVWNGHPFKLDAHLDRMDAGLRYLRIDPERTRADWHEIVGKIIRRNAIEDGYIRIQISRGEGMSSIRWEPRLLRNPTPSVVVIPIVGLADYYAGMERDGGGEESGLHAVFLSRPRIPSRAVPSGMKHCNYLDSILGAIEITDRDAQIGLAVDDDGFVTEGVAYNVFAVRDGRLMTPPVQRDILPGVTRQVILDAWRADGGTAEETDLDAYALCSADEVFVCSTLKFAEPVTRVDGRPVGDGTRGPVTKRVRDLLIEAMRNDSNGGN